MERLSFISGYNSESLMYGHVIPEINKTIEVANAVTEKHIKELLSQRIWKDITPTLYVVGNLQQINMNKNEFRK